MGSDIHYLSEPIYIRPIFLKKTKISTYNKVEEKLLITFAHQIIDK